MFDAPLRHLIDPPLAIAGDWLARREVTADAVTLVALLCGLGAAIAITGDRFLLALALIGLCRILDGLDGAIARASQPTDFGGLFDIAADFVFYGAIPVAFVIRAPETAGIAGAVLLSGFCFNAATLLAMSAIASRRGWHTEARGKKSMYFPGGITEGGETIAFFILFCLFPGGFAPLAFLFAALTYLCGAVRLLQARAALSTPDMETRCASSSA